MFIGPESNTIQLLTIFNLKRKEKLKKKTKEQNSGGDESWFHQAPKDFKMSTSAELQKHMAVKVGTEIEENPSQRERNCGAR